MNRIKIFSSVITKVQDVNCFELDVETFINKLKLPSKITWLSAAGKSYNVLTAIIEYKKND